MRRFPSLFNNRTFSSLSLVFFCAKRRKQSHSIFLSLCQGGHSIFCWDEEPNDAMLSLALRDLLVPATAVSELHSLSSLTNCSSEGDDDTVTVIAELSPCDGEKDGMGHGGAQDGNAPHIVAYADRSSSDGETTEVVAELVWEENEPLSSVVEGGGRDQWRRLQPSSSYPDGCDASTNQREAAHGNTATTTLDVFERLYRSGRSSLRGTKPVASLSSANSSVLVPTDGGGGARPQRTSLARSGQHHVQSLYAWDHVRHARRQRLVAEKQEEEQHSLRARPSIDAHSRELAQKAERRQRHSPVHTFLSQPRRRPQTAGSARRANPGCGGSVWRLQQAAAQRLYEDALTRRLSPAVTEPVSALQSPRRFALPRQPPLQQFYRASVGPQRPRRDDAALDTLVVEEEDTRVGRPRINTHRLPPALAHPGDVCYDETLSDFVFTSERDRVW